MPVTDNKDGNWLQPTWEYMHTHPYLDVSSLSKIHVWEDGSQIVAVAHYESTLVNDFDRSFEEIVIKR